MIVAVLLNKIKALFLVILGLIKRSLCCLRRRRRLSCDSDSLTNVGVIPHYENQKKYDELQSWSAWEDPVAVVADHTPQTIQQHIEYYRQQVVVKPEEEPQANFFEDMTPRITRQTKVLLRPEQEASSNEISSRLSFVQDAALPSVDGELGSWEEKERDGIWEEAEQWDTEEMVREKKQQEREKRMAELAKKRIEREQLKSLGSRIS